MKKKVKLAAGQRMLVSVDSRYAHLLKLNNPLARLSSVIDFEFFRPLLSSTLRPQEGKPKVGAPAYDVVLMFKILLLQRYYGLGDHDLEYQIVDRLSFQKFLNLGKEDKVPDEKTIWLFRTKLITQGLEQKLFDLFHDYLEEEGFILNEGKMIDASFVLAPKQRNSRAENKKIKAGEGSDLWEDKEAKQRQKDIDARWTKKNGERYYGYKNHIKVDAKSKLIDQYEVSAANTHDSQVLDNLLKKGDEGQSLYADSAYTGEEQEKTIEKYKMDNQVNEKGYRNTPLTEEQKENNRKKSQTRARVEHVFGFMEQSMNGLVVHCIGMKRTKGVIGLMNLTYNLFRYEQIVRLNIL